MSREQDNPEFLGTWPRVIVIFLALCVAFAPMQLWLVLSRSDH